MEELGVRLEKGLLPAGPWGAQGKGWESWPPLLLRAPCGAGCVDAEGTPANTDQGRVLAEATLPPRGHLPTSGDTFDFHTGQG